MRCGITGASGLVGRDLIPHLAACGWSGVAVARRSIPELPIGWKYVPRDAVLADQYDSGKLDALIHLEVRHHVFNTRQADEQHFNIVNVGGTRTWLEWCTRRNIPRFILFSSIKAVQAKAMGPTDESARPATEGAYGCSKAAAEELVRKWSSQNTKRSALIVRPAVIYGDTSMGNIAAMVDAIRRRRFFLVGANTNVKSLVSLGNVTSAMQHLLEWRQAGSCEIFNLVDRESYSVAELDARIRGALGRRGHSPRMPPPFAQALARLGDWLNQPTGRNFPLTTARLRALLETSHFSCDKLMATGFVHPEADLAMLLEPLRR